MRSRWRTSELVREAGTTFGAAQRVALILATSLSLAILVISGSDLRTADKLMRQHIAAGITVFEIRDVEAAPLNTAACLGMESATSVIASGARLTSLDTKVYWQPGGVELTPLEVTSGVLRSWVPDGEFSSGVFVGQGLAETIGLHPGAELADTRNGTVSATITGKLDSAIRTSEFQSTLVRVTGPIRPAEACVFRVEPNSIAYATEIAAAAFPNHWLEVVPYQKLNELSLDPVQQLNHSILRFSPIAALILSGFVAVVLGMVSRKEYAVYRVLGTRLGELWYLMTRQYLWQGFLVVGVSAALTPLVVLLLGLPVEVRTIWYLLSGVLIYNSGLLVLGPLGQLLAARGVILDNLS